MSWISLAVLVLSFIIYFVPLELWWQPNDVERDGDYFDLRIKDPLVRKFCD